MLRTSKCFTALILFALVFLAPAANAQKVASKRRAFPAYGLEFKPIANMTDVPVSEELAAVGIIGLFTADKQVPIKDQGTGERFMYRPTCKVWYLDPMEGVEEGRGTIVAKAAVTQEFNLYGNLSFAGVEAKAFKGTKGVIAERMVTTMMTRMNAGLAELVVDVYSFQIDGCLVVCAWDYPASKKYRKKWGTAVRKSMKTMRPMKKGLVESEVGQVNSDSSYADLLAYHTNEVSQTPGWYLVETPSKQYLIKTNVATKARRDIKLVIKRLEASRKLYEVDFPPSAPITSVSVVRVCATPDEFQIYGEAGEDVCGFFNPASEELVLYFGEGGRDEALAVMAHEGFHQYCHFLFNRSEAHRWFDEGHGDHYGAWDLRGKKLVRRDDMRGALTLIPEIKAMLKSGQMAPLSKHIRYSHAQWQNQGPTGISCYAQSFTLIRFLRDGAEGKVNKRYWKKEYAQILPNYVLYLNDGYERAYEHIVKETSAILEAARTKGTADQEAIKQQLIKDLEEIIARPWDALKEDYAVQIRARAMDKSWGQIDEVEFEKRWLAYINKVL